MKRIKTISKNIRDIIQSKKKSIIIFIDQNFIPHFISLIQLKKKKKKNSSIPSNGIHSSLNNQFSQSSIATNRV